MFDYSTWYFPQFSSVDWGWNWSVHLSPFYFFFLLFMLFNSIMNKACSLFFVSIYSRCHTMTDVYTAALLPTKPSSDADSRFRHGFRAEASLPLTQNAPAVTRDTTRLFWINVSLWDCHIPADAVRTLSWIFFYVFPLVWWRKSKISQEYGGWVGNETSASNLSRKYIGYPAISETLFSQILIFFQLRLMCPVKIFFKRDC